MAKQYKGFLKLQPNGANPNNIKSNPKPARLNAQFPGLKFPPKAQKIP
jgi:hypothetical protein